MAERKAVNKYYPPDWDPAKGSVNKHVGQHPLRERAKKLSQGILIIRFEMPYNIWCGGCGNHIGMGVRYNAEKKKVGNYYTTPIYRFRMKCHLCVNYIEIETDPKNCEYTIISGARRKEERWDPSATENVQATDHAEKQKLIDDAMYKLEHGEKDKRKSKAAIPGLLQIKDIQAQWKDDFALNQMLRTKFRQEKKVILDKEEKDQEIKDKGSLDIDLVNEDPEDIELSKRIRFRSTGFEGDQRKRRLQIKARSIFTEKGTSDKNKHRASLLEKRQKIMINKPKNGANTSRLLKDLGIKRTKDKIRSNKNQETDSGQNHNNAVFVKEMNIQPQDSKDMCEKGVLEALGIEESVEHSKDNKTNNEFIVRTKSQTVKTEASMDNRHDKTTNDRRNVSPEKESCRQNISLISDIYSDTDSDNSK